MRIRVVVSFSFLQVAWGLEATCLARPDRDPAARVVAAHPAKAAPWLAEEGKKRAPYYLKRAKELYKRGVAQQKGKDKSNSDPFIKQYEAINQVLAAIDLAPSEADTWIEAGKVTLYLGLLDEGGPQRKVQEAIAFFARGCKLDKTQLEKLHDFVSREAKGGMKQVLPQVKQTVQKWMKEGVPEMELPHFANHPGADMACSTGAGDSPSANPRSKTDKAVSAALESFTRRTVFPTYLIQTNVAQHLPEGFCERLAGIAMKKYKEFGAMKRKERPDIDPNDLNDNFFGYQLTGEESWKHDKTRWPELYRDSQDFKILVKLMRGALKEHVLRTGLVLPEDDREYRLVLWAAVYPGDGGRHGYHVHQGSIASCTFYAKSTGTSGPIAFVDPRGGSPINDYEQYIGERDYEPQAPFHRHEYVFPDAGDLVCFPSWLVHMVPSIWGTETRVAFAANLQASDTWDAWHRTATVK